MIYAEQSAVAVILMDGEGMEAASGLLTPNDFANPDCRRMFELANAEYKAGKPYDAVTLMDIDPKISEPFGRYVDNSAASKRNLITYCRTIKSQSNARKSDAVVAAMASGQVTYADGCRRLAEFAADGDTGDFSMQGLLKQYFSILERRSDGEDLGLTMGIDSIDEVLMGMRPQELIVVGAEQGIGKSAFALQVTNHLSQLRKRISFFSLEMSRLEIIERMTAHTCEIPMTALVSGELNESDWSRMTGIAQLRDIPLTVHDKPGRTIDSIHSTAAADNPDLIVIDHLHIVQRPSNFNGMADQIAYITRSAKGMAKTLDCPVVLLAQVNREGKKRGRPTVADLYGSSAIEQDANTICLLSPGNSDDQVLFDIAKNRKGKKKMISLAWSGEFQKFSRWFGPSYKEPTESRGFSRKAA